MTNFSASDDLITWASSLSAMLTTIRTRYHSGAEMLESPEWDEARTLHALQMIHGIQSSLKQLESEMRDHVNDKC